ncbi:calcium-dependent protein kinase 26-like isoform X2 [Mangifera indica]|uniref:calcium-dependent protein kinase 26-like isoform X2 n=1 Tax=Mangifera indica TaxID=29780 RepID=UPI001CFAA03E|nr:calcium-dependent protein kinase 26-like isoform X2 [Mangifera indica]
MAVAKGNSSTEPSRQPCNCYKVESLTETILEANEISDLKDRFILGQHLGWGQFGVIRVCSDKLTGELFACKSINKDRLVTSDDAWSVKLEIEIMTRLSGHPNVVDLKAVYEDENSVHLVMELCAGGELFHQLEKYGRFSEVEARILFRHLMQVVLYCHEIGVVHRDLKPENILLATKASSSPIKLADFGLATYINPGQSLHGTVGSPFYIAPEVLTGGYNQAADVWSAGVILYILLSGMPPFWGNTKSQIFDAVRAADLRFPSNPWDNISESAKSLVMAMLSTNPSQRLTAQQVLDHSWMKDNILDSEVFSRNNFGGCPEWDIGSGSFSTPFMIRQQDISFGSGTGSPILSDVESPAFTCGASFSSFSEDLSTPCSASANFSFFTPGNSNNLEFTSSVPSMPSFAFFGTGSIEQGSSVDCSTGITRLDASNGEASLVEFLSVPDSSPCFEHQLRATEHKAAEVKRAGGTIGPKILGIHSKRNRTIGLGEREQLDIVVSESVIRWASCTNISIAPSLRSSLVC